MHRASLLSALSRVTLRRSTEAREPRRIDRPRRRLLIAAAAAGLAATPLAVLAREGRLYRWRGSALGARASLLLAAGDRAAGERLAADSLAEIRRLERVFSLFDPASALSRLNRDGRLADPPPELLEVLALSRRLWRDSAGAFDPSVQPLWRALAEAADPAALAAARARVGFAAVAVSPRAIAFERAGIALTLNGIAQGFVTDRVAALLARAGLTRSLVQLGETRALGRQPDGGPWRVGIADPRAADVALDEIALIDRALAVSGGYGTPLGAGANHLIDPRRGESPPANAVVAVTAPSATLADGLSTAAALLPRAEAAALVARYPETEVRFFAG